MFDFKKQRPGYAAVSHSFEKKSFAGTSLSFPWGFTITLCIYLWIKPPLLIKALFPTSNSIIQEVIYCTSTVSVVHIWSFIYHVWGLLGQAAEKNRSQNLVLIVRSEEQKGRRLHWQCFFLFGKEDEGGCVLSDTEEKRKENLTGLNWETQTCVLFCSLTIMHW